MLLLDRPFTDGKPQPPGEPIPKHHRDDDEKRRSVSAVPLALLASVSQTMTGDAVITAEQQKSSKKT